MTNSRGDFISTRKSTRLKGYDYSNQGLYFITICTKNRINYFGEINNDAIILNESGKIAYDNWFAIENHFENTNIGNFIIMPNHIHGIIEIRNACMRSLQENQIDLTKMTLCKIIQQYKASVTRNINKINNIQFQWQKSYYEHIIRNENELNKIQEYIINNPLKWQNDNENIKYHSV